MSAVRLADADARPGRYYVTVRSRGSYVLALGPFTQPRLGKEAHARALAAVERVRRYVTRYDRSPHAPWYEYGTAWTPLYGPAEEGKLNTALRTEAPCH